MRAWIGLGGNQPDSAALLEQALAMLDAYPDVRLLRRSSLYRSPPWGIEDQPDFVNAVAELESGLSAPRLLEHLHGLELRLGRRRQGERWGPRCVDLDLLTYEDLTDSTAGLELPHPRMHLRAFVLVPLLELEPDFVVPGLGPAAALLESLAPAEVSAVVPLQTKDEFAP